MKVLPTTATRRIVAVAAVAVAGLAISTAAYAATSSPGAARTPAAAIPRCTAGDLGAWVAVDQGNGAAGTIYYPLEFTNLSHHTCYLFGYPGVSALDVNGRQLGSPASWGPRAGAHIVNLAPGATAHTLLGYHDVVVNTAPGCAQVKLAVDLRIYPPDQRSATDAAFPVEACSHAGPVYMTVEEPIIPGVGTIYG
jgi:hypothetical protein